MVVSLVGSLLLLAPALETQFIQIQPAPKKETVFERSPGQKRAVLLIHGLRPHPFSNGNVAKAEFHGWQRAQSKLVQALAKDADVYAFAYGQNTAVEKVADCEALGDGVKRLKELGYGEIVMVGHSAGGLIARQFVEDHAGAGVTKVVQVCAPNGGSVLGGAAFGVRRDQEVFIESLTKKARAKFLDGRQDKKIPGSVEFVCVVANGTETGDGVVACRCQWTEDLRQQGIPAVELKTTHFTAMRSGKTAERIAEVVRDKHPRWDEAKVEEAAKRILGTDNSTERRGGKPD